MAHMTASLDAATLADGTGRPLPAGIRAAMFDHFGNAATHLVNQPGQARGAGATVERRG